MGIVRFSFVDGSVELVRVGSTRYLELTRAGHTPDGSTPVPDGISDVLEAWLDQRIADGGGGVTLPLSMTDVQGLATALADKAPVAHGHAIADTTGLQNALDALSTALGGKAAQVHGHAVEDVTGLSTTLADLQEFKADSSELAAKADLVDGKVPITQLPRSQSATGGTIGQRRPNAAMAVGTAEQPDEAPPLAQVQGLLDALPEPSSVDPETLRAAPPWRPAEDFTLAAGQTAVVATNFVRPLATEDRWYRFRIRVPYDIDQGTDVLFKLVGPAGTTLAADVVGYIPGATGVSSNARPGVISHDELVSFGGLSTGGVPTIGVAVFVGECYVTTAGDLTLWTRLGGTGPTAGSLKAAQALFDVEMCAAE